MIIRNGEVLGSVVVAAVPGALAPAVDEPEPAPAPEPEDVADEDSEDEDIKPVDEAPPPAKKAVPPAKRIKANTVKPPAAPTPPKPADDETTFKSALDL